MFGLPDERAARQIFDGFPEHMAPLDETIGTSRVFGAPRDGPLVEVEVEVRAPYIADAFVLPSGDARFGGVELTWLRNDRVMTRALVSLEPVGDMTAEKFIDSAMFDLAASIRAQTEADLKEQLATNPAAWHGHGFDYPRVR